MVLVPCYNIESLDNDITIETGLPCSFPLNDENFNSQCDIILGPRGVIKIKAEIQFDIRNHDSYISAMLKPMDFKLDGKNIQVHILSFLGSDNFGTVSDLGRATITFTPLKSTFLFKGDERTKLTKVIFHIFDFKNKIGTTPDFAPQGYSVWVTELMSTEWKVELQTARQSVERNGLYPVLTHIGCLSRIDGSTFEGYEAQQMLEKLDLFLTFCHGTFCNPLLPVGFNEEEKPEKLVWAMGNSLKPAVNFLKSWCDPLSPQHMVQLFSNFMLKLEDKQWEETFNSVVYWYARSNNVWAIGMDTAIVLSQIAMEKLSYEYAVNVKKMISDDGFTKLSASDELRLLYANLDIPIESPPEFLKIQGIAKQNNLKFDDSFHFLTNFRNNIVHPKHKHQEFFSSLYVEAYDLSLWYLELAILKLCDYDETYVNRLSAQRVGQVENVPWRHSNLVS
jgi:hypothetical protein